METEIISMAAGMLHGDDAVLGCHTSGGTESILSAMWAYKQRARHLWPHIQNPNVIAPVTIHPCMDKACHYFGLDIIHTPVGPDFRANTEAMEKAITPDTILLAVSAPQYPHVVVDPVEEVSQLALSRGLPLHVDSCLGGFMLPWLEKLGYPVPKFDFRCPGVTSISADTHKWGYCCKGSSVILYQNDSLRRYQIYSTLSPTHGLYASPSLAGTRPGGNIASAWATIKFLGEEGYTKMAGYLMEATLKIYKAIEETEGIYVIGEPVMNAFALASSDPGININAVGDAMERRGFKVDRNVDPDSLHFLIMPHHVIYDTVGNAIDVIRQSVEEVKTHKHLNREGTVPVYGMVAKVPDRGLLRDFVTEFFMRLYR